MAGDHLIVVEESIGLGALGGSYAGAMPTCAMVSFRLGGRDGVSIEAAKWQGALETLGFAVHTVAGEGPVDCLIEGLGITDTNSVDLDALRDAVAADLVIVENLCSLPLNERALTAVTTVLAARPAILHHHDLPWQRPQFDPARTPPTDRAWAHVTINELSRIELAARGIDAITVNNAFDPDPPTGDRTGTRSRLGIDDHTRLILQPTRALQRKNIAGALASCAALSATYWLLGDAEDGYDDQLAELLSTSPCPVISGPSDSAMSIHDAYSASDAVIMPSTWEGFGNPVLESATHDRPLIVNRYPVARELEAHGFTWFALEDVEAISDCLNKGGLEVTAHNRAIARRDFNLADLPQRLAPIVEAVVR